jgi:polysaccharide export outer membrane protein
MSASADLYQLAPHTKLRLTVLQWNPSKGEYLRWEAVSGEFTVSEVGSISLPLLGSMPVANLDSGRLAVEIAKRLQAETGLLNKPDAVVEILEYPPIYVVGSVNRPGEYQSRPGMTVLQALALAGGRYRPPAAGAISVDQVTSLGELRGIRSDMVGWSARISRLQAEMSGSNEIRFPAELTERANDEFVADVLSQERAIFSSRRSAEDRQLTTLAELQRLLSEEIKLLEEKGKAEDTGIKLAEEELARVGSLVEKGIVTVSRKSDLELVLASRRASRLDQMTAIMRARQNLTQATRDSIGLRDQRLSAVAVELQNAQADLERLKIRERTVQQHLLSSNDTELSSEELNLTFTIVRQDQEQSPEIVASESTALSPGDVLKVSLGEPAEKQAKAP